MRKLVIISEFDVLSSRDNARASGGPNSITNMVETAYVHVFRTCWNEIHTLEVTAMKLINHETLEGVGNWVNVIDPTKPRYHILCRDHKPSIDHQR
jgi:hypothetical protein